MDLSETLLLLVGAVAPDGGRGVGQALRAVLAKAAPFDAAEAVLRRRGSWAHNRLDGGDSAIAGDDLLGRLASLRAPLRLDDLPEAASFPDTERRMGALGLRSLLAIPFAAGAPSGGSDLGGPEGAVVLARRFGWAFAGVSLHFLWPVAGVAGRAFELAIALTALTERNEELEAELARLEATPSAKAAAEERLLEELDGARREAAFARAALLELRAARAESGSRVLDLEGVLGETAAERDVLRAERDALRDKMAQAAEALETERRVGAGALAQVEAILGRVAEVEAVLAEERARAESRRAESGRARAEADALLAERDATLAQRDAAVADRDAFHAESDAAANALQAALAESEARGRELEAPPSSATPNRRPNASAPPRSARRR